MKELQKRYWFKNILWYIIVRHICQIYAKGWRWYPLISYPLSINILFGDMKYYYLKNGLKFVINRIVNYDTTLMYEAVYGKEDVKKQCLTEDAKLSHEIDIEIQKLSSE